jgi:hypothetical protein
VREWWADKILYSPLEDWRKTKTVIGGTKQFKFNVIDASATRLDYWWAKEGTKKEGIDQLSTKYPV